MTSYVYHVANGSTTPVDDGEYTSLSALKSAEQSGWISGDDVTIYIWPDWANGVEEVTFALITSGVDTVITAAPGYETTSVISTPGYTQAGVYGNGVGWTYCIAANGLTILRDIAVYSTAGSNSQGRSIYAPGGRVERCHATHSGSGTQIGSIHVPSGTPYIAGCLLQGSGHGILKDWVTGVAPRIYNCVATNDYYMSSGSGYLYNCVYAGSGGFSFGGSWSGVCNYCANEGGTAPPGANSIQYADLGFVDEANGDYAITSSSVLRGAGLDRTAYGGLTDYDGDVFPDGSAWDIGVDYYVASGPTTHEVSVTYSIIPVTGPGLGITFDFSNTFEAAVDIELKVVGGGPVGSGPGLEDFYTPEVSLGAGISFNLNNNITANSNASMDTSILFNVNKNISNIGNVDFSESIVFDNYLSTNYIANRIFESIVTFNKLHSLSVSANKVLEALLNLILSSSIDQSTGNIYSVNVNFDKTDSFTTLNNLILEVLVSYNKVNIFNTLSTADIQAIVSYANTLNNLLTTGSIISANISFDTQLAKISQVVAILNATMSLQQNTTFNNSKLADMQSSVLLEKTQNTSFNSIGILESSVSFGTSEGVVLDAQTLGLFDASLDFNIYHNYSTQTSNNTFNTQTNIGIVENITSINIANLFAAAEFNNQIAFTASGGGLIEAAIIYAINHQEINEFGLLINGNLDLTNLNGFLTSTQSIFETNTNISHQIGLQLVVEAILNAGLTLSNIQNITYNGNLLSFAIELSCGRILLVTIENRILLINEESRLLNIDTENRVINISSENTNVDIDGNCT